MTGLDISQAYVALLIGDWGGALESLVLMANQEPESRAAALEYRDEQGNTLLHRAVMAKDAPDISQVYTYISFIGIRIRCMGGATCVCGGG